MEEAGNSLLEATSNITIFTTSHEGSQKFLAAIPGQEPELQEEVTVQEPAKVTGFHTLYITGNIRDHRFQQAATIAQSLASQYPKNVGVRIVKLTPMEWVLFQAHRPVGATLVSLRTLMTARIKLV